MPTSRAIASVDAPSKPCFANSVSAASRISSRRSSAVFRGVAVTMCVVSYHSLPSEVKRKARRSGPFAVSRPGLLELEVGLEFAAVDEPNRQRAALLCPALRRLPAVLVPSGTGVVGETRARRRRQLDVILRNAAFTRDYLRQRVAVRDDVEAEVASERERH